MENDLMRIWQRGNASLLSGKEKDRKMIAKQLGERTLKGSRMPFFSILFYLGIQIVNTVLISMNLAGYGSNASMMWILGIQLVVTIGIMVFGTRLYFRLREINNYSVSVAQLIEKQMRFFNRSYELWLVLAALSALILIWNINFFIDNQDGRYPIYNKWLFGGISVGVFVFIYGAQKLSSMFNHRSLIAYLDDLRQGILDNTVELERKRRSLIWVWILVMILLSLFMVLGLIRAF